MSLIFFNLKRFDFLKKLNSILSKKEKGFLSLLFVFSIFIAIIETLAVSILMPFIAAATNFKIIQTNKYFQYVYHLFRFSSYVNFIVVFGIGLILFYIIRSIINIYYQYILAKFSFGRYLIFTNMLFKNYLAISYINFIDKNTSNFLKTIVTEASNLTLIISISLAMMSEIMVIILIYSIFIFINWKITILLTIFLLLNVFFIIKFISKQIKKAGEKREKFQKKIYEILNASFGNFKMIKLKAKNKQILDKFSQDSFDFSDANIRSQTLIHAPRYIFEGIGFSLICFAITYLVFKNHSDIKNVLPIISVFVLGLYRILPASNRILTNYNSILYYKKSLDIVYDEMFLKSEELGEEPIEFKDNIEFKNVSFSYVLNKSVLKNVNMVIRKGDKIAIVGKTGSGKSTLVDIIIGLFKNEKGEIYIDNTLLTEKNIKSWRQKIGYVSQSIYLFDATVAENIAMSKEIDKERVRTVLNQVDMLDFFEKHKEGIETHVGEGGIKLSGGQKQRVAIARALYNDPEIIVLDEATSSLDTLTESQIMETIYEIGKDKTLIIVAHRLSTISKCEKVYKLESGELQ